MTRTKLTILFSFLFFGTILAQEKNQITYIANEGLFIEKNGKKVLIDALHDKYLDYYEFTRSSFRLLMTKANAPFETVDLFLVTHVHGDHFDKDLTVDFFEKHKETILVAPQQVLDTMGQLTHLEAQFYPIRGKDSGHMFSMDGIDIQTIPLLHSYQKGNAWVENMGYILDFDGFKILHVGDAEFLPENLNRLKKAIGKGVDYAILPDWFFENKEDIAQVKQKIKAKKYRVVHIMTTKPGTYNTRLKKRVKAFNMDLKALVTVGQFETIEE